MQRTRKFKSFRFWKKSTIIYTGKSNFTVENKKFSIVKLLFFKYKNNIYSLENTYFKTINYVGSIMNLNIVILKLIKKLLRGLIFKFFYNFAFFLQIF